MKHLLISRLEKVHNQIIDIARDTQEDLYTQRSEFSEMDIFGALLVHVINMRISCLAQMREGGDFILQDSAIDHTNKFKIMQELYSSGQEIIEYTKHNPTGDEIGEVLFKLLEHEVVVLSQLESAFKNV